MAGDNITPSSDSSNAPNNLDSVNVSDTSNADNAQQENTQLRETVSTLQSQVENQSRVIGRIDGTLKKLAQANQTPENTQATKPDTSEQGVAQQVMAAELEKLTSMRKSEERRLIMSTAQNGFKSNGLDERFAELHVHKMGDKVSVNAQSGEVVVDDAGAEISLSLYLQSFSKLPEAEGYRQAKAVPDTRGIHNTSVTKKDVLTINRSDQEAMKEAWAHPEKVKNGEIVLEG